MVKVVESETMFARFQIFKQIPQHFDAFHKTYRVAIPCNVGSKEPERFFSGPCQLMMMLHLGWLYCY